MMDAARSRLDHRPGHPLGAEDDVLEIGPVQGVPAVLRCLEDGREEHSPGVVDQDADRSELRNGAGQGFVDLRRVADVDGQPEPSDLIPCLRGSGCVTLPDRHRGAECGQSPGDAAADAGSSPGHHGHPVGQKNRRGVYGHEISSIISSKAHERIANSRP